MKNVLNIINAITEKRKNNSPNESVGIPQYEMEII